MVGADIVILPAGKLKDAEWPEIRDEFGKMISIIENNSC